MLSARAAGVALLPQSIWVEHPTLQVLGDVNAVPPRDIESIKVDWNDKQEQGNTILDPISIRDCRIAVHHASVARLFERSDLTLVPRRSARLRKSC